MKTAIYGVWHVHARDYLKKALELGEVIGVYDEDEKMRKAFCDEYGVKEFLSSEELLQSDAEGVIVCSATDSHVNDIIKIAKAEKHIFTEKVLALCDEDCDKIEEAVRENGVNFVISLPHKYRAAQRTVKKVAESGELGKINFLRYRNCHSGSVNDWLPPHFYSRKQCGGGAMIDLGAHGMYLTDWILGMPNEYSSTFAIACENQSALEKNSDRVEDNAITVMKYNNGCIAVNETGFVSYQSPLVLEVGGERGYVRMEGESVVKRTFATDGKAVDVELEEELPLPIEQFLTGNILEGCSVAEAKNLTHMMTKAYEKNI